MRLSHTTLFALAALCYTSQAFVIPLGRVTSAPSPTKRALVGRHERDRGHGHGRHGQHGPSGQQNQGAPSDQQEGHAQDGQQGGNVVTVYTTVTGSPPEQTSSDSSGDRKECKGGKKGPEEHQEAAQTPPEQGPNEPPKAEDQSPPVMGQTETPLDPKDTGREGSDDAKQPQPLTAANNGEMGIQAAQRKQSEDSKGQEEPPANNGDSGEAKKQDPPAKPEDEAKPPADTHNDQGGASHSDVPDDPVPQAKKAEGNPTGGNVLTSDEQQKVLALHNSIREANGQPKLEWDDKLASFSAGWMNKCVSHHDHSGGKYGENMGGASGKPDPVGFVKMWTDEDKNYNCEQPKFAGNIGHYTALMWKDVKYVGCSLQECANMGDGDASMPWHWSCNYWPAPNDVSDQMARYKENVPCSKNKPQELS